MGFYPINHKIIVLYYFGGGYDLNYLFLYRVMFSIIEPTGRIILKKMDSNRIPKTLLNYRPHGKRSLGRPLKRWSETVTGHLA
jgi:hypothetical protein